MRIVAYGESMGSGGYVRYCQGVFGSGATPPDVQTLFVCSESLAQVLHSLDSNVHVVSHPWIDSRSRWKRWVWLLFFYPRLLRKIRPDLEFYPNAHIRAYMRRPASCVTTCHNLLLFDPLELSLMATDWKAKVAWNRAAARQASSMRRSQAVIFPSEHAQNVVSSALGGHISSAVVPHGVDSCYFEVPIHSNADGQSMSILYVSTILSYKHQDAVVTAVADLRRRLQKDIRLTLVGSTEVVHSATSRLSQTIRQEHAERFTTVLGEVPHDQVLSMMWAADIFVFASSCEVFGIALLEAMAAGLPIACSSKSGLPDLLLDGGVYFDPFDSTSIADAIEKLVLDSGLRDHLSRRAREIARSYSWKESARATYAVLMHASIGPSRVIPDE